MWGSYGSYSSMSASSITGAIDIAPSSSSRYHNSAESHCAMPSWGRRSSFDEEDRPSAYLSDDDLFPSDPLEDDSAYHIPSPAAGFWSPLVVGSSSSNNNNNNDVHRAMEEKAFEGQRLHAKMVAAAEKERKRAQMQLKQQMMAPKKRKNSSKTSPRPKPAVMAPISE